MKDSSLNNCTKSRFFERMLMKKQNKAKIIKKKQRKK